MELIQREGLCSCSSHTAYFILATLVTLQRICICTHTYIQVYETRVFHTHKESVGSTYNSSSNHSFSKFRVERLRGELSHVPAFASGVVREISRLQLPVWIVLVAKEAEVRRGRAIMIGFDEAGIRVRRIIEFSQSVLRSGVQRSCVLKQCDGTQEGSPELAATRRVREYSSVALTG
jgi:hypothetical protein